MFTHKMCESCSTNIQLSKRLPSPRFLKQFNKAMHIAIFLSVLKVQQEKHLWTLLAVPNKMPFFIMYIQRLNTALVFWLYLVCLNIAGGVKNIFKPLEWSQLSDCEALRQSVMVASQMLIIFICILTEFQWLSFLKVSMWTEFNKKWLSCIYVSETKITYIVRLM